MNCEYGANPELIERYVSGQLPGDEADRFELHYFACDECLVSVQTGQAIRSGAAVVPAKVLEMPLRRPARARWLYPVAAAAVLLVASLAGWRLLVSRSQRQAESAASVTPQVSAPSGREATPVSGPATTEPQPALLALNGLTQVDPLPYRGAVLRGAVDDTAARFRDAMEAYTARDYRQAAANLSKIPVSVPGSKRPEDQVADAGIELYLGVSRLMIGRDADAIGNLRRAILYGDTPYLESAGYYLAKGLIRQSQYEDAAAQLRKTIALDGDRKSAAQELLEQIDRLPAKK